MAVSLPWLGNSTAMNTNPSPDAAAGDQIYEDVSPEFKWLNGDKADTLIIDLGGVKKKGGEFEKEHLLVQVDDGGKLVVSGRRHLDGRRWRRFQSPHSLPHAADASRIRATFDGSLLSIIIPKLAALPSPPVNGGGRKSAETEKEPALRAREEKSGSASDAKKQEEKKKKKKTEVPREEERGETPPHLKAQTAGPNSRTAARRDMTADPQSPPADGPRRRRRSSPAAKFTRRAASEKELVVNVVAAAAVLLMLGLYLVYRYSAIVDSRELLPISAV